MQPAHASSNDAPIRDNYGSVGMIDMPTARMARDGELSAGASFFQNTQHYNFNFQILPWLETSFRYSGLQHFDPAYSVYYDRSFAVRARLWDESAMVPAFAIGINDLIGTGIYSGEYLVASKRFRDFDASLGIGWGRIGSTALFRNPLANISSSLRNRVQFPDITPGATSFNTLFHGTSSGLFGGIVWHTPIQNLSLIAEYSSDTYAIEALRGNFRSRNQMNYGASYQVADNVAVGLNWLYGRSIGGNVSIQLNPAKPAYPAKLGTAPPQVTLRSADERQQALELMMHQRKGTVPPSRRASENRAAFVDALWHQDGVRNIELKGHSLLLTASGDVGRRCIASAQLAQFFESSIQSVTVRSASGANAVQCVTMAANAPAYQSLVAIEDTAASPPVAANWASTAIIDAAGIDAATAMNAIRSSARKQQITIEAIALTGPSAIIYYNNTHYFSEADALDRLTRILMKETPPEIEKFRIIAVANGVPQQEFDILRGPEERKFAQSDRLDLFGNIPNATLTPPPMQNPVLAAAERKSYPRFSWSIFPQLRQELFDPNNPFAVQLATAIVGSAQILPGLSINGEAETSLFDNFNIDRLSDSSLPHVRSDFLKYFAQGKTGLGELSAAYRFRATPTVFGIVKAGYLESMFAGGGGELLWRPQGQRWALGVDAYEVWQRGFDRLLDLQNYHAFTGHASLYYASPWHELNFMLSAGQYLAGDRGLTFQVTRRFSTGMEIGAFFTKTNISAREFGEGSFDKGIIIRIPLGWALPIDTQGQWDINLRPIQRDGGQRLLGDTTLFEETRRTNEAEIMAPLAP